MTVVGAVLAGPSAANAQSGGTADPQGGVTLAGPNNTPYKSAAGNPLNFDSTIQFQGLTASGQAKNSYVFQSNYQAVTASETLSLSGSLAPGYNNSYASLSTGATISGMYGDPQRAAGRRGLPVRIGCGRSQNIGDARPGRHRLRLR